MKAIQLNRFGGPGVLDVVDVPVPVPGKGEVLLRIHAAGVNFFETLMRADRYVVTPALPMTPGVEIAGVVEAAGEGVDDAVIGTRVAVPLFATSRPFGGYAEYVAVNAASVVPLPHGLSFDDAAALMVQGLTALYAVRCSPPHDRQVLVSAAAGGVGSLLVQLAKDAGARRVIATAGSREKLDLARSLGADVAVDYGAAGWSDRVREATTGEGVDIVYDFVGGTFTKASLDALAPRGEIIFGALGRFELSADELNAMFPLNQSLKGFALLPLLAPANLKADLADLFARAACGDLKIVHGGRYSLDRAADAHRALEGRRTTGKILLVP